MEMKNDKMEKEKSLDLSNKYFLCETQLNFQIDFNFNGVRAFFFTSFLLHLFIHVKTIEISIVWVYW